MRPTWDVICTLIAWIISLLATCTRLKVGAVLWNPQTKQIVAIAYNGAPRGQPHCLDKGCEIEDNHCVACLHAEDNIFYWAGTNSEGCHLYLTHTPCRRCVNKILQGKVKKVVRSKVYGNEDHLEILRQAGILVDYPYENGYGGNLLTDIIRRVIL
jgi:dCMP deaminase